MSSPLESSPRLRTLNNSEASRINTPRKSQPENGSLGPELEARSDESEKGSLELESEARNIEDGATPMKASPLSLVDRNDVTEPTTPSVVREDLDSIHYIPELDAYFSPGRTFSIRYFMIMYGSSVPLILDDILPP